MERSLRLILLMRVAFNVLSPHRMVIHCRTSQIYVESLDLKYAAIRSRIVSGVETIALSGVVLFGLRGHGPRASFPHNLAFG